MAPQIRIGTAGWSIASVNADLFPAQGSQLERYAGAFNAVEINSSFYRPHRRSTYERWAQATPSDFAFSVKAPKTATHERRLVDCGDLLDRFVEETAGLEGKLGAVLVQLPPSLAFDRAVATSFFQDCAARFFSPIVVEPRHASWFTPEADAVLALLKVSRAAADPALAPNGEEPGGWPGMAYWRWHGAPRLYFSAYEKPRLKALGQAVMVGPSRPTWIIFDNTAGSAAARDAATVRDQLRR